MSALGVPVQWLASAEPGIRFGRSGDGSVVEWSGLGTLMLSGGPGQWRFLPNADLSERALRKFSATDLVACRRYFAGKVSLHGAAVSWPHGAIVLLGESGEGKSTTAMELMEGWGGAFLADDVVAVDAGPAGMTAEALDDSPWLGSESRARFGIDDPAEAKIPVPPRRRAEGRARVRLLVHLVFDDAAGPPSLERIAGQESFLVLSRAHYSFAFGAADATERDLDARAKLAAAAPLYRLRRPRRWDAVEPAARILMSKMTEIAAEKADT